MFGNGIRTLKFVLEFGEFHAELGSIREIARSTMGRGWKPCLVVSSVKVKMGGRNGLSCCSR